jgi:polysaccharide pyruvyl transferase WcaK-like protein
MVKRLGLRPARGRRVIYLVATSGHPNYGDELITRKWLRALARTQPDAQVWLDCPNPGPTAALFAGEHPGLQVTDTLFRLCWEAPDDDPQAVGDFVREALGDPGAAPRWLPGILRLREVDVFHVLGGGYVNTVWPRHLGLVAAAQWVAENTSARVGATGLGVLPLDGTGPKAWAQASGAFDVLAVRDEASHQALAAQGVRARLAPDDAFLGGVRGVLSTERDLPDVMVCVQTDLVDGDFADVVDLVRRTLVAWDAQGSRVGFVECIPRVDRAVYDALRPDIPDARFFSLWDLLDRGFPARAGQRWISSRYHPHILAAAAGAEGVALNLNEDYYGVKHAAVRDWGSGWTVAGVGATAPEPGPPGTMPQRAEAHAAAVLELARDLYRP